MEELDCSNNELTALDVSANKALTSLICSSGNQFSSLDVSANTALTVLSCSSNGLTSLDVSRNTALKQLDCDHNNLSSLVVSSNTSLKWLCCQNNNIGSLDLSANANLVELNCSSNAIGSLKLGNCPRLEILYCSGCSLKELDLGSQKALTDLRCYDNQLTNLSVAGNTKLTSLDCKNNQIVSLDLSQNARLGTLYCSGNKLTSLSLNPSASLSFFNAGENACTIGIDSNRQFDLSKLPGFSADKASEWSGGSVDGNGVLTVNGGAAVVTYSYDCGANKSVTFKLKVGYVVRFDTGGGSEVAEQTVEAGDKASRPENDPIRKWHIFDGWYADEDCTRKYDFENTTVDAATTIYAKWIEDADPPSVTGIEDDKTYCSAQKVTVTDEHLDSVAVNGVAVALDDDGSFTLGPATGEQKVVATDRANNVTTVTVTVNDGHTWNEGWSHSATEHWHECSVCGVRKDVGEHSGGVANCISPAACSVCQEGYGELDPSNHEHIVTLAAKAATCTENGLTEGVKCSDCGKVLVEQKAVPATGHRGGTATCAHKAVCETCVAEYGELNPEKHEALEHVEAKEATTAAEGNVEYWRCAGCGKLFSDEAATKEISQSDTVIPKKSDGKKDEEGNEEETEKKGKKESEKDGKKKGGKNDPALPKTGDDSPSAALPLTAGLSTLALAALAALAKRRSA